MLSRRSLFALMGAAGAAPMAAVAAPTKPVNAFADYEPIQRYTHTAYGLGYAVTERPAVAWFDPRGHFLVSGYDAQGQRVTEHLDA